MNDTIETYMYPVVYKGQDMPSVFNGIVRVKRYKVIIEEIQEPKEVIEGRLNDLLKSTENHHNIAAIRQFAHRNGYKLTEE